MYALIDANTQTKIREAGETTHLVSEDQSWLPITYEDRPEFDRETQDAVRVERVDGLRWLKTWEVVELDGETQKTIKRGKLDREAGPTFSIEALAAVIEAIAKEDRTSEDDSVIADYLENRRNYKAIRSKIDRGESPDVSKGWRRRQ